MRIKTEKRGTWESASITVFLSICFVLTAALLLTVTEASRTAAERLYLQLALDSAMESLFSQYHRPLWENYRLLGLEYRDKEGLKEELSDFLRPYMESENLFPLELSEEKLRLSEELLLTEGISFEEEVLEYMKSSLPGSPFSYLGESAEEEEVLESLEEFSRLIEESIHLSPLQREYQLCGSDFFALETAFSDFSRLCENAEKRKKAADSELDSGYLQGFLWEAAELQDLLSELPDAAGLCREKAELLSEALQKTEADFEAGMAELSEEGQAILQEELRAYGGYLEESGRILSEIERLSELSSSLSESVQEIMEEAESFLNELEEEEEGENEEEEAKERRISAFCREKLGEWRALSELSFREGGRRIRAENGKRLEQIPSLPEERLLFLSLPEGELLPGEEKLYPKDPPFRAASSDSPWELPLLGEYSLCYFHFWQSEASDQRPPSGSRECEIEYLISGAPDSKSALSESLKKLLALRESRNLFFLFQSSKKREEARDFARSSLCLGEGGENPALLSLLTIQVLSLWALAQAFSDLQTLLLGGRAALLPAEESWGSPPEILLRAGSRERNPNPREEASAPSYRDYLRALLFHAGLRDQSGINTRMLLCIERNLRSGVSESEEDFCITDCLYALQLDADSRSRHFFLDLSPVRAVSGRETETLFRPQARSYYKYKNDSQ